MIQQLLFTSYWLGVHHMTIPTCKGVWEDSQFSQCLQQKQARARLGMGIDILVRKLQLKQPVNFRKEFRSLGFISLAIRNSVQSSTRIWEGVYQCDFPVMMFCWMGMNMAWKQSLHFHKIGETGRQGWWPNASFPLLGPFSFFFGNFQ